MAAGLYDIALNLLEDIGPISARTLVSYCGGTEAVFKESKSALLKIPGIGKFRARFPNREEALVQAEKELKLIDAHHLMCLFYLEDLYPSRLRHHAESPLLLYIKGNTSLNFERMLAVVGTRTPTDYGRTKCEQIIETLNSANVCIVSGLAYGIDSIAHRASLTYGLSTVAVLGNGLPKIYPSQNSDVARQIIDQGGSVISQFPIDAKPDREHFPMRNKTVAFMTDATLVIESRASGGSMITANFAFHNHKDLFALPGRSIDVSSEGCNKLIKANMAQLVTEGEDIMKSMLWERNPERERAVQTELFIELSEAEKEIFELIKSSPEIHIDQLLSSASVNNSLLVSTLLQLELKGLIKQAVGKRYLLAHSL